MRCSSIDSQFLCSFNGERGVHKHVLPFIYLYVLFSPKSLQFPPHCYLPFNPYPTMKKLLFPAIILGILTIIPTSTTLQAQGGSRGNCGTTGTNCWCTHARVELRMGGSLYITDYTGNMVIHCVDTGTTVNNLWWWKHSSTEFSVTGTETTLGTITVYLDSSRTQPDSYLTSLSVGNEFPASHHVYAYAKATISSMPGTIFRSTTPFHMYNNSVPSFGVANSHIQYTVDADVDFEDVANPGTTVFIVVATPTVVNP